MGRGVVAHGLHANFGVDHGVNFLANMNRLPGDDFVGAHALYWGIASLDFGHDGVVLVVIKPSGVAHLAAGIGIKRRMIENNFALFARLQFFYALPITNDSQYLAVARFGLAVAFEDGLIQLAVSRRSSSFTCAALP